MESQLKMCPKCGKIVSYKAFFSQYMCDRCGWMGYIEENKKESNSDRLLRELFLDKICNNYNCGSQRCDCSPEWVDGCTLFKEFKEEINAICEKLLNK